jgi:hypothetical protein
MIDKRSLGAGEIEQATVLQIIIPSFAGASHPFSVGRVPEIYTAEGLKKIKKSDTARTDWFLKRLCTIREIIGGPVPFYFRTANGELRSLDAGCIGYLVSSAPARLKLNFDPQGFISSVEPTEAAMELSWPQVLRLRPEMEALK